MDCSKCIYASPQFTPIYCTKLQKHVIYPAECLKENKRNLVTDRLEIKKEEKQCFQLESTLKKDIWMQ